MWKRGRKNIRSRSRSTRNPHLHGNEDEILLDFINRNGTDVHMRFLRKNKERWEDGNERIKRRGNRHRDN